MRNIKDYNRIKALLDKLEKEGVEPVYQFIKKCKPSFGSSGYSAVINDLIACCPSAKDWNNSNYREFFKQDVIYYCEYYLDEIE